MPIRRPSEREQRPSALEIFTGREDLIAAFERALEGKNPEEHRVLVFHGDGGIGKTTLLHKLEQLHRQRHPQALMARLDFAGADTTPPDLLLYRLRRLFPTIPFPSFSLALAEYGRRFHPEQVYGKDRQEFLQGAGPYADALADGLDVLWHLSGVGLAVSTMKAVATAQRQVSAWIQQRAEPWLQRSQGLSEEELLAELPLQWARDFRQALASQLDEDWDDAITYSGPPPLITLDTYETIWHAGMGRSGRRREPRERWLVDLVSELPEVLWVIGGRDRLSWVEGYDRGWSEACEQHLVGQLSEGDARSFLAKRGIEEPTIVEKIVGQSAGVPFYLELESQLYHKTLAEERTPEVFGGSQQEQVERLLTHLDPSERATLKLMAAFGIWDQELFRQAVTHFATGYPATGAAELGRFWSIESIGEGRWQLHNEMAHHLQVDELRRDRATYKAVHEWGFAYFDGPLNDLNVKDVQAEDAERLRMSLRHAQQFLPGDKLAEWLIQRLRELGKCPIWTSLIPVVERGVQIARQELGANDSLVASLISFQARFLYRIAEYKEAEVLFRQALEIDANTLGGYHPNTGIHIANLAQLLHDTDREVEAEPLMLKALLIAEASYGPEDPKVAVHLNNLAQLLKDTNRPKEAERLMLRALAIDECSYGQVHPAVATRLNNLALLMKSTDRIEEAEPLMRRALGIFEAEYGRDHPIVATALNNLALLLKDIDRIGEAEPLMRRALSIDESNFGPAHPAVAMRLRNLASVIHANNRPGEAELLMRRALLIDEDGNGPDHQSVAKDLNGLG